MGRIRKVLKEDGEEREVKVWVAPTDDRGRAVPLKTNVTERFPKMSRRDRRRLVRESAKLAARSRPVTEPKEERRVILTDEVE